jgi:hypothetical protein
MNETPIPNIRIWQQNLNKSLTSQHHLLSSARPSDWDILILQEPWMGQLNTRSSPHWRVLYPDTFFLDNTKTPRSLIMINTNIPTNSYEQIHFRSPDVTGIRITEGDQTFLLINIYNDCRHNLSLDAVSEFLLPLFPDDHVPDDTHIIFAGDFNRHHGWWEEDHNSHLTSSETSMQPLFDIIHRYDLRMALPPKRPTLRAHSTGNWTRPDNVWCTSHTSDLFIKCDTNPGLQGPITDHLPILSTVRKLCFISNFLFYFLSLYQLSPSFPFIFTNSHSFILFIHFHDHHTERTSKEHIDWQGDNNPLQNSRPFSLAKGVPRSAMYLAARLQYCSNLPTSVRTTVHNRFPISPRLIIDGLWPHRSHHLFSLLSRQLHRELQSIGGVHLTLLHQATMTDYPSGNSP